MVCSLRKILLVLEVFSYLRATDDRCTPESHTLVFFFFFFFFFFFGGGGGGR